MKVLADEQQATAIGFLVLAVVWFSGQGVECRQVMSDNGSASNSKAFAKPFSALNSYHIRIRLCTHRTNGKANQMIQIF